MVTPQLYKLRSELYPVDSILKLRTHPFITNQKSWCAGTLGVCVSVLFNIIKKWDGIMINWRQFENYVVGSELWSLKKNHKNKGNIFIICLKNYDSKIECMMNIIVQYEYIFKIKC